MHQTYHSKTPSLTAILQQQKKYSAQQAIKIHQSNHKLDQLEQKMKSLLVRDRNHTKSKSISVFGVAKEFNVNKHGDCQPNSDEVDRYFELSKKFDHNGRRDYEDGGNDRDLMMEDDLLLDNDNNQRYEREDDYKRNNSHTLHGNLNNQLNKQPNQQNKPFMEENKTKREKSTSSLKIFKNPTKNHTQSQFSIGNQKTLNLAQNNHPNINRSSKSMSFGNPTNNPKTIPSAYRPQQQLPFPTNPNPNPSFDLIQSPPPHPDITDLTHLQQMMQKSLQIKQKQLSLSEQQLQQTQQNRIQEYRRNMELQILFDSVKRLRSQMRTCGVVVGNGKGLAPELQQVKEDAIRQKGELERETEGLVRELKLLEEEEYRLKLEKKRTKFEFGSLEREFQKILKLRRKRMMKENQASNGAQRVMNLEQEQTTQRRVAPKRQPSSSKVFKTHKKHLSSTIQPRHLHQSSQYHYQDYLQPKAPTTTTKRSLTTTSKLRPKVTIPNNPKQKSPTLNPPHPFTDSSSPLHPKPTKSSSLSNIQSQNRHTLSSCQAQYKNCPTDRILYEMVHELDRLKDVVRREIVKTKGRKEEGKEQGRRVIEIQRGDGKKDIGRKSSRVVFMR